EVGHPQLRLAKLAHALEVRAREDAVDLARRLKVMGAVDLQDQGSLAGEHGGHLAFQLSYPLVSREEKDHLGGLALGTTDGEGADQGYLDWDVPEDRDKLLKRHRPPTLLWVFDAIHKYRLWRTSLTGLYDGRREGQRILVTGSARLDYYRYSGDSLQGRYHLL